MKTKLTVVLLSMIAFTGAAFADDCRLPDGTSKLGALVDTSFLPDCEAKPEVQAAAVSKKQLAVVALKNVPVEIPYITFGSDE